jgi:hypothetical protein
MGCIFRIIRKCGMCGLFILKIVISMLKFSKKFQLRDYYIEKLIKVLIGISE